MGDLHTMTEAEIERAIDALIERAAKCSPPANIVEAAEQAAVLRRLAQLRDEMFRRAVAARAPSSERGRRKIRTRAGNGRPLSEDTIDRAMERLAALQWRARENVLQQARDPATARVLIEAWCEDLITLRIPPARFRKILTACEQRGLVQISGPFVGIAGGRAPYLRASGAARHALEVAA